MVSVELMIRNPSVSAIAVPLLIVILPPSAEDQVMEGAGTPLAVQVNETELPSTTVITTLSVSGVVMLAGAA